jgi:hypothetical protein
LIAWGFEPRFLIVFCFALEMVLKLRFAVVCLLLLLCARWLAAQSTTGGAIAGAVVDAQGRVIPNAHLALRNPDTGFARNVSTNEAGSFYFEEVTPGTYTLMVGADGFAPWLAQSVTVEIGRLTHLVPTLAVGTAEMTVSVNAQAPALDTTSAVVATNIDQTQVDELPSNGRRWSTSPCWLPALHPTRTATACSVFAASASCSTTTPSTAQTTTRHFSQKNGAAPASAIRQHKPPSASSRSTPLTSRQNTDAPLEVSSTP